MERQEFTGESGQEWSSLNESILNDLGQFNSDKKP
jgi:hypothetical protein